MKINILPFILEAFGTNQTIREDVDKLYATKKDIFYKFARESELYNHGIIKEGDIYREEYAKKALGIFAYTEKTDDKELVEQIIKIMQKGWPMVHYYLNKVSQIDFHEYMIEYLDALNKTDDESNSELAVLYFFAHTLNKEIKTNRALEIFEKMLISREQYYNSGEGKFCYRSLDKDLQQKALSLKQRVYDKKGPIKGYMDIYLSKDEDIDKIFISYSYLFDTEWLTTSILQTINYKDMDINDIMAAYFSVYKNQNVEEAIKYIVPAIIIKGLLKAYKEVKEYYFKNNKETMYIEMQNQEDKIHELELQNKTLISQNQVLKAQAEEQYNKATKQYQEQISELQKQIRELKAELEEARQNEKELFALREFIFSMGQDEEQEAETEEEIQPVYTRGVIIGGREKWQKRMKEILPNFTFITIGNENFDTSIFNNAEIVLFNTSYLNHKLYYKAINEVRKRNLPIKYISNNV